MPRQLKFTVAAFDPEVPGKWYVVRVLGLSRAPKSRDVRVTLEHVRGPRKGHVRDTVLSLPVRPRGRTAEFFQACGCSTEVGEEILQRDVVGRTIEMILEQAPDGSLDVAGFRPLKGGDTHDADAE